MPRRNETNRKRAGHSRRSARHRRQAASQLRKKLNKYFEWNGGWLSVAEAVNSTMYKTTDFAATADHAYAHGFIDAGEMDEAAELMERLRNGQHTAHIFQASIDFSEVEQLAKELNQSAQTVEMTDVSAASRELQELVHDISDLKGELYYTMKDLKQEPSKRVAEKAREQAERMRRLAEDLYEGLTEYERREGYSLMNDRLERGLLFLQSAADELDFTLENQIIHKFSSQRRRGSRHIKSTDPELTLDTIEKLLRGLDRKVEELDDELKETGIVDGELNRFLKGVDRKLHEMQSMPRDLHAEFVLRFGPLTLSQQGEGILQDLKTDIKSVQSDMLWIEGRLEEFDTPDWILRLTNEIIDKILVDLSRIVDEFEHRMTKRASGDAYEKYLEKERQKALDAVREDGRDRWKVEFKGRTHDVSINRRSMTYTVSFGDGSAVQVIQHANGAKTIQNHTGDTSKGHAASEIVKKIQRYEEAMAGMYGTASREVQAGGLDNAVKTLHSRASEAQGAVQDMSDELDELSTVPAESYPEKRIKEVRRLVSALGTLGIGVILNDTTQLMGRVTPAYKRTLVEQMRDELPRITTDIAELEGHLEAVETTREFDYALRTLQNLMPHLERGVSEIEDALDGIDRKASCWKNRHASFNWAFDALDEAHRTLKGLADALLRDSTIPSELKSESLELDRDTEGLFAAFEKSNASKQKLVDRAEGVRSRMDVLDEKLERLGYDYDHGYREWAASYIGYIDEFLMELDEVDFRKASRIKSTV